MSLKSWIQEKNNNSLLEENIFKLSSGDVESLVYIYEETNLMVYGFVLSILRNIHESEDVLQELYIKIYENAFSYKKEGKPLAWIFTIAKNLCYMRLRKQKDMSDIDEINEYLKIDNKEYDNIDNKMLLSFLFQYISLEERNILMLHIVSGFKFKEIAEILDLSLSTVLSKYHRAIKKIKIVMEDINEE